MFPWCILVHLAMPFSAPPTSPSQVANLTLMALGSSAPEILLSRGSLCGESWGSRWFFRQKKTRAAPDVRQELQANSEVCE
jgi:hypothetical protein